MPLFMWSKGSQGFYDQCRERRSAHITNTGNVCDVFVFLIDFSRHLICSVLHFLTPAIYVSGRKV